MGKKKKGGKSGGDVGKLKPAPEPIENFEIVRNAGKSLFEKCQFEQFDAVSTKYKEFLAKKEAAELAAEDSANAMPGKAGGGEAKKKKKKK